MSNNEISEVIGSSAASVKVLQQVKRVARLSYPVLLLGQSGAGKNMLAELIHRFSGREGKPFKIVTCSAIPSELLESELFGFEKGAFTHAVKSHSGKFAQASDGTILLDEIGDLPGLLQAKLLGVLDKGEYYALGSEHSKKSNARVIAATNKNLREEVAAGRFREDLFYRLNVISIHVPSLVQRQEDILLFVNNFVRNFNHKNHRHVKFSTEAIEELKSYHWPGNVRQLESVVTHACAFAKESVVDVLLVRDVLAEEPQLTSVASGIDDSVPDDLSLAAVEKKHVLDILGICDGKVIQAAKVLGIGQSTLFLKLKKWKEEVNKDTNRLV